MTLIGIIQLIPSFFKFFDQIKWLITTLQGTPQEHQDAIMKRLTTEADAFKAGNRPVWD